MTDKFKIRTILAELGLSGSEISVYLMLVQSGNVPASQIANKLKLNRSTVRYNLENLFKKRLIIRSEKNGTFYFMAEEPEKILLLLQEEKQQIDRKEKHFSQIIGDLKNLQNPYAKLPKVQFFEGVDGVKKAYAELIEELPFNSLLKSFSYPLTSESDSVDFISIVNEFIKQRIEKNIFTQVLMPYSQMANFYHEKDKKDMRETRFLRNEESHLNPDYGVEIFFLEESVQAFYAQNTNLFSYKISHPGLSKMQLFIFDSLWQQSDLA